jgi:hypothetical protein
VPGSLDRPGQPHAPDGAGADQRARRLPPERFDQPGPADRPASGDEPARWSRADLRQRLERLPPGHPSSLGNDDPDPDEWTDIEDDRPMPRENAEPDRTAPHEAEPDRQPDDAKRDYWSEVPRFLRASADHERRWPEKRTTTAVDRSHDPDGSWRGDGNQYLDPDQHTQTNEEIARVRQTEESLTEHIGEAERDNACGGWLEGLEFRRKGDDRLKEKMAGELEITPAMKPEDAIKKINDAIRYTFCFESSSYADGYWDMKQRLEAREYQMVYSKNHWRDDPEYKGINTRWATSDGHRFEVQFHTTESFHAKQQVTHRSYERLRNPLTQNEERGELEEFQREVSHWIPVPQGAHDIPDYFVKGR